MWQLWVWCHPLRQTTPHTHTPSLFSSLSLSFSHRYFLIPSNELLIWIKHAEALRYAASCPPHPQTVCTVCLLAYFCPYSNTLTHSVREGGGEVVLGFMFGSFLNGNFCSALMFAAVPTSPMLHLWHERRNIYLQPQRKTSKPDLALTFKLPNIQKTQAQPDQPQSCRLCSAFTQHKLQWFYPSAHKLLAGDWVPSKPPWTMRSSGFIFWPWRKETHETVAHQ